MWRKFTIQSLSVEQHFHGVEADAAAVGALFRGARATIKRVENVLELLFGEWLASVFDGQLMLVAGDCYHAPGVAVAHRV